jgi:hypothetical protein
VGLFAVAVSVARAALESVKNYAIVALRKTNKVK